MVAGTLVERAAPGRVLLSNGQEIATRTVVWSAGVRATELAGLHELRASFRYREKGTMAVIGRNAAVASIGRLRLTGRLGWLAWLTVHIYYLIGFRNRAIVLINWAWNYLRKDRPIRMITSVEPDPLTDELTAGEAVAASPSAR